MPKTQEFPPLLVLSCRDTTHESEKIPVSYSHNILDLEGNNVKERAIEMETERHARERKFDEDNGLSKPKKTINAFGSFALVSNNISGPAMMGLPHLFHVAGILPVVSSILLVFLGASLTGSLLSDSIASIPGNKDFNRNLSFSKAFKIIVGVQWYFLAESLFVLSCMVQACASLVETAQSLDGFIASFLLGRTYGIQFLPTISVLTWNSDQCHIASQYEHESSLEDCLPFNDDGSLVFTLGFLLTTLLFLPFGRGQLKEAIGMQLFSFFCFFIMMAIFHYELYHRGLTVDLPLVGDDIWQVAGVVLFNFAFTVTVPSWLNEKRTEVSVNKTIWGATSVCSIVFLSFGLFAAFAFDHPGTNILVILSSNKVHAITRICSAIFGVAIIGCGVPVFCVIIKTSLYANRACSGRWSFFFGALLPYLISWTLYQGKVLITVLNWAGLVVNGLVAFILPLVLVLKTIENIRMDKIRRNKIKLLERLGIIGEEDCCGELTDHNNEGSNNINDSGNNNVKNNHCYNDMHNDHHDNDNDDNSKSGGNKSKSTPTINTSGTNNRIRSNSHHNIRISPLISPLVSPTPLGVMNSDLDELERERVIICEEEGYGHDELDHYDYDISEQDRDAKAFENLYLENNGLLQQLEGLELGLGNSDDGNINGGVYDGINSNNNSSNNNNNNSDDSNDNSSNDNSNNNGNNNNNNSGKNDNNSSKNNNTLRSYKRNSCSNNSSFREKSVEYESFLSFNSSLKDIFSSSNSDRREEVGHYYRTSTFLESITKVLNVSLFRQNEQLYKDIDEEEDEEEEIYDDNTIRVDDDDLYGINSFNRNKSNENNGNDNKKNENKDNNGSNSSNYNIISGNIIKKSEKNGDDNNFNNNNSKGKDKKTDKKGLQKRNNEKTIHNKKILNLSDSDISAIKRFAQHTNVCPAYNNTIIHPLPLFLESYRKIITSLLLTTFTAVIISTVTMTVYNAIAPDNDDAGVRPEYHWSF